MFMNQKSTLLGLSLVLSLGLEGCFVAAAGSAATGSVIAVDRRTTGTIVDDQAIELKAIHALKKDKELWDSSHLRVVSYNNVVLLLGQTPTPEFKEQAEASLSDVARIRRIHNELSVTEPISLGTRTQDSWITTKIKAQMLGSKEAPANRIKVVTEDKVVYLMGLTTPEEQIAATEIAQSISGVEKIVQVFEPQ